MPQVLIAVCAITRDRPVMFGRLVDALAHLETPEGVIVLYLCVENGPTFAQTSLIADLADRTGRQVEGIAEPRLGIPFARNAALVRALALNATHLAFVDDDEVPPPDWLVWLWAGLQRSGVDLVSGPILPMAAPDMPVTARDTQMLDGLCRIARNTHEKNRRLAEGGRGGLIPAATNNWLCRLDIVRRTDLRFREEIGLGGGSDVAFWHDLRAAGGTSDWIPDAVVAETLPAERLTLRGQIDRARYQALDDWRRRLRAGPQRVLPALPFVLSNLLTGLVKLGMSVLVPVPYRAGAARCLGKALGRIDGLTYARRQHYARVTGH